ncbi:hypothetical protein [Pseudomarimonas arenosa]|uniref:Cytochrome C Planctomycete-type domain-containing protein n=1 Tax=Pseudomarimonas arenosa TaxID=2774145 RepID=A0AAW3ZG10_9GAMM|nr:hypothetical protein [Pseudomarimonas arenosa]MBD8525075.1 hypothetical protein [Pseudomarimonas arenosa]
MDVRRPAAKRHAGTRWQALLLTAVLGPTMLPAAEQCESINGTPITFNVEWQDVWRALDQQSSCTQNCHVGSAPAAELDFSSLQISIYYLVGQLSAQHDQILRVKPGDPQNSLLFQKVNCAAPDVGRQMPPSGHVPLSLQTLIYDWIAQGARGELPEDPIPREFIFADAFESEHCLLDPDLPAARQCSSIEFPWRGPRS